MKLLFLVGVLMIFAPILAFIIERGGFRNPETANADWLLWLMTRNPEQVFLMSGSFIAGITLMTAALAQRVWSL